MRQYLADYLTKKTLESFLALRNAHLAQVGLNPYSVKLNSVGRHLAAGNYREAADLIAKNLLPDYIMSAGTHLELAVAQKELGSPDKSAFERFLAQHLVLGIEMTGDGTERRPYLVTRPSDEYDFLIYRKQTPSMQVLVESGGLRLDRIDTERGEVFWFDITEIHALMERSTRR
jgi:hypothetical protein